MHTGFNPLLVSRSCMPAGEDEDEDEEKGRAEEGEKRKKEKVLACFLFGGGFWLAGAS